MQIKDMPGEKKPLSEFFCHIVENCLIRYDLCHHLIMLKHREFQELQVSYVEIAVWLYANWALYLNFAIYFYFFPICTSG